MTSPTPGALESLYDQDTTPRLVQVPPVTFLYVDGHGDPTGDPSFGAAVGGLYACVRRWPLPLAPMPCRRRRSWNVSGGRTTWRRSRAATGPSGAGGPCSGRPRRSRTRRSMPWSAASMPTHRCRPRWSPARRRSTRGSPPRCCTSARTTRTSTIEPLHAFIHEQECWFDGSRQRHHEIYLSDPGQVPPEQQRTIVRQPCTQMT